MSRFAKLLARAFLKTFQIDLSSVIWEVYYIILQISMMKYFVIWEIKFYF